MEQRARILGLKGRATAATTLTNQQRTALKRRDRARAAPVDLGLESVPLPDIPAFDFSFPVNPSPQLQAAVQAVDMADGGASAPAPVRPRRRRWAKKQRGKQRSQKTKAKHGKKKVKGKKGGAKKKATGKRKAKPKRRAGGKTITISV